jgi:ectoine hydroxylase
MALMNNTASRHSIDQSHAVEDTYPSRKGLSSITDRQDPVIYAPQNSTPPIDPSQIEQFEQQGFIVLDNIFSSAEIEALQDESARLRSTASNDEQSEKAYTEPGHHEVRSIFSLHENSTVFKKLMMDERLAGLARYILNDQVYIHQSRLNYKPGFIGKEFFWHSDFETWHVEDGMPNMRALSMSVTLTENHTHNGPLMLIPGSHKKFIACEGKTPRQHHLASLKKQEYGVPSNEHLSMLVEKQGITTVTSKPGSVIVFDCNTLHGSNGNITPHPRANVFFVYNALSNKVAKPFCEQPPRPEYLCARSNIKPLTSSRSF